MKKHSLLLLIITLSISLTGQIYNFTTYSSEHGVQSQVQVLYQDSRGNIWLGTANGGVNMFDGSNFTNYSKSNGLCNNNVHAIIEDKDGNMWFGTEKGLDEFDGKNFTHFVDGKDELVSSSINSLQKDISGNIWICSINGVDVYDGKKFIHQYTQKDGLRSRRMTKMFRDNKSNFWFSFDDSTGVDKFDGKKFIHYTLGNSSINAIAQDEKGNVWFNCSNSMYHTRGYLYHYNGAGFDSCTVYFGHVANNFVSTIFFTRNHHLWLGMGWMGVYETEIIKTLEGKDSLIVLNHFSKENGLGETSVASLLEDRDGNMWIGTNGGGVSKYGGQKFIHYNEQYGLDAQAFGIMQDKASSIWAMNGNGGGLTDRNTQFVSVGPQGVYKCEDGINFVKQHAADWLKTKDFAGIHKIFKDSKGNLWIFVRSNRNNKWDETIMKYDGSSLHKFSADEGYMPTVVSGYVCEDKNGFIYFGTPEGILKYNPEPVKGEKPFSMYLDITKPDSSKTDTIHTPKGKIEVGYNLHNNLPQGIMTMFMDDQNNLWFSSWHKGVFVYDGKKVTHYFRDGLNDGTIRNIFQDKRGTIWLVALNNGVNKFNGNGFTAYEKKQGFTDETVTCFAEDDKGNIFFGTDGDGIIEYNGSGFIHLMDSIKMNNTIMGLCFDNDSNLWALTNNGIAKLTPGKRKLTCKVYGKDEGFVGIEGNQGGIFKDSKGNLWFGTSTVLTKYNPQADALDTLPPQTHITAINLFFEKTDWSNYTDQLTPWYKLPVNITLPYNKNHLTFQYTGVGYQSQHIVYKIMLEGLDKTWSPETDKKEITYSNLAPGKYTFKVLACNEEGIWNKEPEIFSFVISPPWYGTWWAYTLYFIIVGGGISGFITWRIRKLKAEKEHLELVVTERTAEVVKQKALVEEKNKDILDSITYAKRLQDAILPPLSVIKKYLPESFVLYKPKDIVAGDFYWLERVSLLAGEGGLSASGGGEVVLIAACDCTGHGVPGALVSVVCSNALNRAVKEFKITEPGKILDKVRELVVETFEKSESEVKDGMDVSLCCINTASGEIQWSGAHNPLWYVQNGELKEVPPDKQPIGVFEHAKPFNTATLKLNKGDILYLFTDGYADQFGGPKGKKFKYKQLQQLIMDNAQLTMAEQGIILEQTLEEWKSDLEQVDDILIIGIRV